MHNTGNTEGAYRAVITGTNGPVTASMDGLDGQPTQSIATFRLPGLSIGAITVDTDLKSAGTGKVMVEVAALDAALTGTDTATVRAQDQPPPQPSGPAAIPTLDEWMQALLALLMLLALAWVWRRRSLNGHFPLPALPALLSGDGGRVRRNDDLGTHIGGLTF